MSKSKILSVALGAALVMGPVPTHALATELTTSKSPPENAQSEGVDEQLDASVDPASATAAGSVTIERDGAAESFETLAAAIADACDGEVILVSGDLEIAGTTKVSDGRRLTLRATGACTLTRSNSFVQTGARRSAWCSSPAARRSRSSPPPPRRRPSCSTERTSTATTPSSP